MLPFNTKILPEKKGVYVVGGSTRDLLLGLKPIDYDLTVSHNPEQFAAKLARRSGGRLVRMGKPGKLVYRVVLEPVYFDITPINGPSIMDDLRSRDFTINAMAIDVSTGQLLDVTGGRKDLEAKRLRMVSGTAFRNDPIRLLRAYRLAASLGFAIEPGTVTEIHRQRGAIRTSAGERIRAELLKIFAAQTSAPLIRQMADTGLLFEIFNELRPLKACSQNQHHAYDVFQHTLIAYESLESILTDSPGNDLNRWLHDRSENPVEDMALLKCALLLHDIGKPQTARKDADGAIHFLGHESAGAQMAEQICNRLRFSHREREFITQIITHHTRTLHLFNAHQKQVLSSKATARFLTRCGAYTPYLLLHTLADLMGKGPSRKSETAAFSEFARMLFKTFKTRYLPLQSQPPLITGHDLIKVFHLSPSPLFKKLLSAVTEQRLADSTMDRKAALELVKHLLNQRESFLDISGD
ncbi:MAG: CCA tRNA nucleotidyltransferase [Deltaproteobacteria bacterium]|nr:CCA tRNA nucleotidyltransferase [Deltaproteobacteria bacterium]